MAKGIKKTGLWDGLEPEEKEVPTHKDTHTHNDVDNDVYVPEAKVKQTKTKRIQILTYSGLVRQMDSYAERTGMSRAEVFEQAVKEFLERN